MSNSDLFELKENKFEHVDEIKEQSVSFWSDVLRTLKRKKIIFGAMLFIPFITIVALIITLTSKYDYDESVNYVDDNNYVDIVKLPPKIPILEKFGILDGTVTIKVSDGALSLYDKENYEIKKTYVENGNIFHKIKLDKYKQNEIEQYYFFGTDTLGFDLWTKVWYGLLVSIAIGIFAAVVDLTIGIIYGGIAGYFGGRVDMIMMRISEVIYGIPSLVILMFLIMLLGPGVVSLVIAIGATGWIGVSRMVRAQVVKLKGREFILASKTLGASDARIVTKHIFPNILGQLAVIITFSVPAAIFYEAFLSFIGLGLADIPSIGSLVNEGKAMLAADSYLYLLYIPSLFIGVLMLAFNIFANGLRDALDPRMKED